MDTSCLSKTMSKLLTLLLLCAILAGCEAMSDRIQARVSAVPAKRKTFPADIHTVYSAAQLAVRQIGFTLSRSSEADAFIEGFSRIRPGDSVHATQQFTIEVRMSASGDTGTEVAVRLTELREGASPADAGEQVLREHGLYASYYAALEQLLREGGSSAGAKKD